MRTKILNKAKLVIEIESFKEIGHNIKTVSVFDNRSGEFWTKEQITERGISDFISLADMKETLNWNLNGDGSKFQFDWNMTGKRSSGKAFVFD